MFWNWTSNWILKLAGFMAALVKDGGPSVTRWVFIRTSEIISLGWLGLVGALCFVVITNPHPDIATFGILMGGITTLGAGLFGFAQQAQTTKLAIDSKASGNPSSVESNPLGSKVSSGDQLQVPGATCKSD